VTDNLRRALSEADVVKADVCHMACTEADTLKPP
jgi:hypothetical protein